MSHIYSSIKKVLSCLLLTGILGFPGKAQYSDAPKILVVCAHPDDDIFMAVTIYKITHELGGLVDEVIITNGEGGYRYSLFAEEYYHLKLTDEDIGRRYLPLIRKQELINGGKIIGVHNYYFLDQKDDRFSLDPNIPLNQIWNRNWVSKKLIELLDNTMYDFVFCVLPDEETHGHHKAATILALEAVSKTIHKPVILAVSTSNKADSIQMKFSGLDDFPITHIAESTPSFYVDRTTKLGFNNKLNYKTIANWYVAEHKSQGAFQLMMNDGDTENFWYFDMNNDSDQAAKTHSFFDMLNKLSLTNKN